MKDLLKDTSILIWDFDGTLYKANTDLYKAVRAGEYRTIMNHTGWSYQKTVREFEKLHKYRFSSATQTAAYLSHIKVAQAAVEMESYFDRRLFVKRDELLVELFLKLAKYRHFMLANGAIKKIKQTFKVLGISESIFEQMITSETVGITKPDPAGFLYILKYTKLPAERHLMIGDREAVDLVPAKKLGMKTCLVWSEQKSKIADITLPVVYDVAKIFLN